MLKGWKYLATLANGESFVVTVFSADRDPMTVIRKDLQPQVIDIVTL